MAVKNLDDRIKAAGGAMKLLRDSQTGPNPYPVVKPEYSNWRDEQWAWQNTAVIFNQSYHMTDLYVSGPDAFSFLESLGINSFKGFEPGKAKQYVPVSWDGFVIGDVGLLPGEEQVQPVGRPPVANGSLPRETGRNRHRQALARAPAARRPQRRSQESARAQDLPLPAAGSERDEGHDEGAEEGAARPEVLQHDHAEDRRQERYRAAPRHGGPARLRTVRTVEGRSRGARGADQGRPGIRARAGRRPRLLANRWNPGDSRADYRHLFRDERRRIIASGSSHSFEACLVGGSTTREHTITT